ncbi:MAG: acyltransferase [Mucilaginibacter sp.]|nr:acyltransferase [Mucilaginibacter sp.]
MTHSQYRLDIDGLRALAVAAVVAFHAFPEKVKGGFIGVDIFFVISGFLISTIIFEGLAQGRFDFANFYARRIKRIFPALLVVLATCLTFGWFTLLPNEFKQLGKHASGGAAFVSNFVLWNEAGYFDNAAETKPLLHLWSLGIEEQFYIFFPFMLWLAWKCRQNLLYVIVAIALASYALNIAKFKTDLVADFFSPQTRFWELMIGSILAYSKLHKPEAFTRIWRPAALATSPPAPPISKPGQTTATANIYSICGCLLLAIGFSVISANKPFPAWRALYPSLGTAFLIAGGPQAWINRTIFSNSFLVWLGKISFPLYLWHWPILSLARVAIGESLPVEARFAVIALSIGLAWLTYRFIERPIRFGGHAKERVSVLLLLCLAMACAGYGIFSQDGVPSRPYFKFIDDYAKTALAPLPKDYCFDQPFAYQKPADWYCKLGRKSATPTMFAFGDSHALSMVPALAKYSEESNTAILFTGASGCPPLLGIQSIRGEENVRRYNCQKLNERIFNQVKTSGIKSVLLMARWTYYTGNATRPDEFNQLSMDQAQAGTREFSRKSLEYGLRTTIDAFRGIGVHVYLFDDNPQQLLDPVDAIKRTRLLGTSDGSINKFAVSTAEHKASQSPARLIFDRLANNEFVTRIDFDDVLCATDICALARNAGMLYADDDHLSIGGALQIYPKLKQYLTRPTETPTPLALGRNSSP